MQPYEILSSGSISNLLFNSCKQCCHFQVQPSMNFNKPHTHFLLFPKTGDNISTMRHFELNHLQQLAQELHFNFKKSNTFHKPALLMITTGKIQSVISFQTHYPKKTQTSNNTGWESLP